jgi:hypothetical protein
MFRNGFDFKVNDSILDQNGRYIILDLTVYEQHLTLVCLYGYNTDKPELFTEILQKSAGFANTSFLFCGDWNVVQNKSDNTYNVIHELGIKFPVALSRISRRGRKTKNNGRLVSSIVWNYFGILHERKNIF